MPISESIIKKLFEVFIFKFFYIKIKFPDYINKIINGFKTLNCFQTTIIINLKI